MRALLCLVRKEFLQLGRDKALLRVVVVLPIFQLLVLSYALNNDLRNVRVAALDEDRTPLSRLILEAIEQADVFVAGPIAADADELAALLQSGACDLAVHVPAGFARDVMRGGGPAVGILVDGTNSSIAGRGAGYAEAIVAREAARYAAAAGTVPASLPRVQASVRFLYNPELESRMFMVPGVIVMLVTIVTALVAGMAVVREKEIGTLEQVQVTPLSSLQFVVGKTLPFALIGLVDLALATTFARLWFHVPLAGPPWVLLLGVLAYLVVALGLGLLASAVSHTQQQAMFTVWFFLTFAIMLSGFFFPVQNMPDWARVLTYINPMRFFMAIVRGVLLRGATLPDLADELLILAGMGVAAFGGAVAAYGRRGARD